MERKSERKERSRAQLYAPRAYWANAAQKYATPNSRDFAAVIHPGAPAWFNITIDRLQELAWSRGMTKINPPKGSNVLDVGCGMGRWLRRYRLRSVQSVGVDPTEGMLREAVERGASPVVVGRAQDLPFRSDAFNMLSAVTVIQHLPHQEHLSILQEMARVTRPGGHLLLLELIRGDAPHIFPRTPSDWIATASKAGLSLVEWHGQEYMIVDRAFVKAIQVTRRIFMRPSARLLPVELDDSIRQLLPKAISRKGYWLGRRITTTASVLLEPLAAAILPGEWATHGIFVFKKA